MLRRHWKLSFLLLCLVIGPVYAIDPFGVTCESRSQRRLDEPAVFGDSWVDDDTWWKHDVIVWDGGKEVIFNEGKFKMKVISVLDDAIGAVYSDPAGATNNYMLIYNASTKTAILTHQQSSFYSERVMSRTALFDCE